MVAGLSGHAWFGLVVYFITMGFVIKGVRIPVPAVLGNPIITLLRFLRLRDPPNQPSDRLAPRKASPTPTATPVDSDSVNEAQASSRPSLRSRSESKIGTPAEDGQSLPDPEEIGESRAERLEIVLDLRTAPVVAVIVLLMTKTIDGSVVRSGLVGDHHARPYDVLVLFISLAYISTALDSTGGLRALSFYITQKAARRPKLSPPSAEKTVNGPRLYSLLYTFWFAAGIVVGNDPIILSGTAFLAYFTRFSGIANPTAWTYSQFITANVASAVLVSSNPTNVLLSGAFQLNFLTDYTAWTILPSLVTALVAFPLTYFSFTFLKPPVKEPVASAHSAQDYIPPQILPPDVDPKTALLDRKGAIFHTSLMGVTLAVLVGTSFVPGGKVEVWMVTAAGGLIAVFRDLFSERNFKSPPPPRPASADEIELQEFRTSQSRAPTRQNTSPRISLPFLMATFARRFPTTASTISRLPLSLLPFAGGVFILVQALSTLGFTSIWAGWLAKICINPAATVFFLMYLITFVLCPIMGTNIGATTIMVQILQEPAFISAPHVVANPRILKGAIFSTALASNIGAVSWTFSASLAGLLWVSILKQKGIVVRGRDFAAWNLWFLPTLSTVASAVVLLECYYF